jgi:MFS family permease
MFADYFPPEQLGRAAAIYSVGSLVGAGLAFFLGGWVIATVSHTSGITVPLLGQLQPWQLTFIIVGIPGVFIALLIQLTVRDPPRRELSPAARSQPQPGLWAFLSAHRGVLASHYFGYSMAAMVLFGLLSWTPAYLIRVQGLRAQEAGFILGFVVMIACTAGVLSSGWIMDALRARGYVDAPMRTGMIGGCGVLLPAALLPFAPGLTTAVIILLVAFYFAAFPQPPSTAALQLLAPNRLRARVAALFLFCNSLLGSALGSLLIGWLNDHVFGTPRAVGSSLSIVVCGAGVLTVSVLGVGCRLFRESMAAR